MHPGHHERLRFPRADIISDELQIVAGGLESLFGVMVGYQTGVVVKSRIPLPAEPVEYAD